MIFTNANRTSTHDTICHIWVFCMIIVGTTALICEVVLSVILNEEIKPAVVVPVIASEKEVNAILIEKMNAIIAAINFSKGLLCPSRKKLAKAKIENNATIT